LVVDIVSGQPNLQRFPPDFTFHLTEQELGALRSQIVTLDSAEVNVEMMRAFARLRGLPLRIQLVGPFDGDTTLIGWAHWTVAALSARG
jgi:hypothetical protein